MPADPWPLFGVRLTTPRLDMRYADDGSLLELAEVSAGEIHPADAMPFSVPWTDVSPDDRARSTLQWNWRNRAELTVVHWRLPFVVREAGRVVGVQDLMADEFPVLRQVQTGSWLGLAHQGRGIGTEMRAAVLVLAFRGLGALWATTGAFEDNVASLAVSRKLGYEPDGLDRLARRGTPAAMHRFRLSRDRWAERSQPPVEIHGLTDRVRDHLGAVG